MQSQNSDTEDVRVTVGVSRRAKEIWTDCAKTLGISQWEMTEILFRMADPTNPRIKDLALQVRSRNATIKENKKELTDKLKKMSPEQLALLLSK